MVNVWAWCTVPICIDFLSLQPRQMPWNYPVRVPQRRNFTHATLDFGSASPITWISSLLTEPEPSNNFTTLEWISFREFERIRWYYLGHDAPGKHKLWANKICFNIAISSAHEKHVYKLKSKGEDICTRTYQTHLKFRSTLPWEVSRMKSIVCVLRKTSLDFWMRTVLCVRKKAASENCHLYIHNIA